MAPSALSVKTNLCHKGHPFTESNTIIVKSTGTRECRICRSAWRKKGVEARISKGLCRACERPIADGSKSRCEFHREADKRYKTNRRNRFMDILRLDKAEFRRKNERRG